MIPVSHFSLQPSVFSLSLPVRGPLQAGWLNQRRRCAGGTGGTLGTAGRTCYLLTAATPALPLAEWTCIATNQIEASGNFSFNCPIDAALRDRSYCVQLP